MDIKEIQKYLPHRYPFLMVDRVTEFESHKRIVAIKNVSINEPLFLGHFPVQPVFPGVLIVEALAQAAGILAFKSLDRTPEDGSAYYLAGTDKTKFRRAVFPGDQLKLEVEIVRLRNQWMKAVGRATVDGELVCSTTLTCAEQEVG
ncbi:MAG: 3-hydroxyacyl-ACP dehydratase FabZ [Pseudomonadales bacterium]|jgi:3-hydroxyacyl-[acyl-carrier-protein] dehydratase|nr:3-hydroxyacyl-ACP dehydratase FabZ [Pseudomonadales bacterium]MDP7357743.1 3-hydroxyacyl-ACP dehydratase FabZ [Pseudomonadales bacterium]MDP7596188.1 3-hydroxyacyl-ACP dehydratase FabZ [Pseudomonadales bacterium]HJN50446.1 3-hydroxyacyl-ACP dehydratase FabZ [Pseudomonadales bacterium]|tara:strand:+ start:1887 stop:2324 length:438 start_codon:yes stop_codon:yes gene_type:complete